MTLSVRTSSTVKSFLILGFGVHRAVVMGLGAHLGHLRLGVAVLLHGLQRLDGVIIHEGAATDPHIGLFDGDSQQFRFLSPPMFHIPVFPVLLASHPERG